MFKFFGVCFEKLIDLSGEERKFLVKKKWIKYKYMDELMF